MVRVICPTATAVAYNSCLSCADGFRFPTLCIKIIAISALQLPALHSVDNVITIGILLEAARTCLHTKIFRRGLYVLS
jgi:hypothetical protein